MSLGSYLSDAVPKKGLQDVVDAFTADNGGTKVKVNTVDHGTFQNQINTTCRPLRTTTSHGSPDTACGFLPTRAWPLQSTMSGTL